jgi:hypothetical protein
MPQFITVATTDELEAEGQKIALFRVDGGFKCAGSWGSADAPECVYVQVTSLTLVAYCSVQGEHEQCENSWSPYW